MSQLAALLMGHRDHLLQSLKASVRRIILNCMARGLPTSLLRRGVATRQPSWTLAFSLVLQSRATDIFPVYVACWKETA
jgi:hypothetical protein